MSERASERASEREREREREKIIQRFILENFQELLCMLLSNWSLRIIHVRIHYVRSEAKSGQVKCTCVYMYTDKYCVCVCSCGLGVFCCSMETLLFIAELVNVFP